MTSFVSDKRHRINKHITMDGEIRPRQHFLCFREKKKRRSTIRREFVMANTRSDTSDILVRTNGMRDNTKTNSPTSTKAINRSSPKYFHLSRTLFSDSRIVVTIMMGLFFGSIQGKCVNKYARFGALYDQSIPFSVPLSKVDCSIYIWIRWRSLK